MKAAPRFRTGPFLAAVLLLLAGCGSGQSADDRARRKYAAHASEYRSASGIIHFKVPATWTGRYTSRLPSPETGSAGAVESVAFYYLPVDTTVVPQALLMVLAYRPDAWARLSAEPGPPQGDRLGEQGGFVYVVSLPQSNPFVEGSEDARRFDALALTTEQLKASLGLR